MIPIEVQRKLQNTFTEFIRNYRHTFRTSMLAEVEGSDLTFKQFVYLDTILKMDRPTYGDIAQKFNITKPSVSAIVNKLISLGYLERSQSEDDRRVYYITAGSKGNSMLSVESNSVSGLSRKMSECLSESELEAFISLTEKINANCFQE